MQPVATILDSTAINDGLNKYYDIFFSHEKKSRTGNYRDTAGAFRDN